MNGCGRTDQGVLTLRHPVVWKSTRRVSIAVSVTGLVLVWMLASSTPALGQDPPPPDTLALPMDSLAVEAPTDTIEQVPRPTRRPQHFPRRLLSLRGPTAEVFECDRECVESSAATSLLDLLVEHVPGLLSIRGQYFGGPHHVMDGLFGPGFVTVYLDGRQLLPLARSQADLRRLALPYVDLVRVTRGPDGFIIEVTLLERDGRVAYSRLGASTGTPRSNSLSGVFSNGLGSAFMVDGFFELRDVTRAGTKNDRTGAHARISWMPSSNDFGVQFELRAEAVERVGVDTADIRRNELTLRTRRNLGSWGQIEAYGQTTDYRRVTTEGDDSGGFDPFDFGGEEVEDEVVDMDPRRAADGVGVRLSGVARGGGATAGIHFAGGDAYASRIADLSLWQPIGPVTIEAGGDLSSWNEFTTSAARLGMLVADTLLIPFQIRAFAGQGSRGIGYPEIAIPGLPPLDESAEPDDPNNPPDESDADEGGPEIPHPSLEKVDFRTRSAAASLGLGPWWLSGRYSEQWFSHMTGFGGTFDRAVVRDSAEVEVTSIEARVEGPLLPLGLIIPGLEPMRLRASWRKFDLGTEPALFIPETILRWELAFHDTFFEDNLRIWFSVYTEERGERLVPVPGMSDPQTMPADSWMGTRFMFQIGDFRFFWQLGNLGAEEMGDFPGAPFPRQVNVFGIQWEFFN